MRHACPGSKDPAAREWQNYSDEFLSPRVGIRQRAGRGGWPRVGVTVKCLTPGVGIRQKSPTEVVDPRVGVAPAYGRSSNRSLETVEPVSPQPKRKLENGLRRPAPKTRAQRTEIPEVVGQRPVR